MTQQDQLQPGETWIVGAYSATLDARIPHWVINEQYPDGRLTTDLRQAWEWAHEDAAHFCRPETKMEATDWVGAVWAGTPPFSAEILDLRTDEDRAGRLIP